MELIQRARQTVQGWSNRDRVHIIVLAVILTGAIWHHCALWFWYIEDAAITFAYAKHLAMGEGLVPFVGGERVEGYSNPAWTFFLAPFALVGFDLHDITKWIQVFLLVPTVIVTYLAAREVFEGRSFGTATSDAPLVAPAVLAASAQFAVWTGAGLEMALMNLLVAVAIWRSLVELREGGWPWSALWWVGVALSRPEAILYAAVAGFVAMVGHLRAGRGVVPTVRWLITFFVPFGLYHAWRYSYFAWEFPNTYYAKMERRPNFPLLDWTGKSWRYTRNFAFEMGWGFFLPLFSLGAIGDRAWRWPAAAGLAAVAALVVSFASPEQRTIVPAMVGTILAVYWVGLGLVEERPPRGLFVGGLVVAVGLVGLAEGLRYFGDIKPNAIALGSWVSDLAPWVLGVSGLAAFGLSFGARHEDARRLTTGLVLAAVLFALIAQWDWMNGYRWYAPAVVPGALLFALGAESLARVVQRGLNLESAALAVPGLVTIVVVTLAAVPANVVHTLSIVAKPQTKPIHVKHRVTYVNGVRDTLHVDGERWIDLDVDQGAHLYWSDFEMLDTAGLIDVPFGHHKFERAFLREYLFEEKQPHFIHIHGGWAGSSGIPRFAEFRTRYVEIPGYVANRREFHIGNYVRRNLLFGPTWPPDDRVDVLGEPVRTSSGVTVHGLRVPSEPAVGGRLYVELGLSVERGRKRKDESDFRVWLTAERGAQQHVWELAPAYDWVFPHEWGEDEIFQGRYSLDLPDALTPGTYDLIVVVVAGDGSIAEPEVVDERSTFARGEIRYPGGLTILDASARAAARDADRDQALADAAAGRCDDAEHAWWLARRHSRDAWRWIRSQRSSVHRALATCFAEASDAHESDSAKVPDLVRAREWDHWAPEYRARAREVADGLMVRGYEARAAEDWERAYRAFADAVAVDRSRSWARRRAEEARAFKLGFDEASKAARTARKVEAAKKRPQRLRKSDDKGAGQAERRDE